MTTVNFETELEVNHHLESFESIVAEFEAAAVAERFDFGQVCSEYGLDPQFMRGLAYTSEAGFVDYCVSNGVDRHLVRDLFHTVVEW